MKIPALNRVDGYKTSHRNMFPENTTYVYSNWTPRGSRIEGVNNIYLFGLQYLIKRYLIKAYKETFFNQPKSIAVNRYKRRMDNYLGKDAIDVSCMEDLHDLGYLPIKIKAIEEGTSVPVRVPMLTISNTHPDFFWLTNYLETLISCTLWQPCTSATISKQFRLLLDKWAETTDPSNMDFVPYQGHDFSMRGMSSLESACVSGAGHLLNFIGTDTISAIDFLEEYYCANSSEEIVGTSVPACYSEDTEILTENGFVRFHDLDENIKVAQYHSDGTIDFVIPNGYYCNYYNGEMIQFLWDNGEKVGGKYADLLVTPNHKMVEKTVSNNKVQRFEAKDNSYNSRNKAFVSGLGNGTIDQLSDVDKLKIAFQADGSFSARYKEYTGKHTNKHTIRFSLKKERKVLRLKEILKKCKYEYTHNVYDNGKHSFRIQVPVNSFSKLFNWINLNDKSSKWAEEFLNEIAQWDGHYSRKTCIAYSSCEKFNVEQVQAIAAIAGWRCTFRLHCDKRGDRKTLYTLSISKHTEISGDKIKKSTTKYKGNVYCVSVPSKMLIVKRNNQVTVCGNSEHSVMSMGQHNNEFETFARLITEVYPKGILSIVSDTWNLWKVVTEFLPRLKKEIIERDGKVVIRPDSSITTPQDIICGNPEANFYKDEKWNIAERKGLIECLGEIFGMDLTETSYKRLNPHIGAIYGDAISLDRAEEICKRLENKLFASTNLVYGIGSFTYQFNTRDTFGFAMKATYGVVNGEPVEIFKDPLTDSGEKKSARGLLRVEGDKLYDQQSLSQETKGRLKTVFKNGMLLKEISLQEIRDNIKNGK